MPLDYMVYQLKYDSVHGRFNGTIAMSEEESKEFLVVNGNRIQVFTRRIQLPLESHWFRLRLRVDWHLHAEGEEGVLAPRVHLFFSDPWELASDSVAMSHFLAYITEAEEDNLPQSRRCDFLCCVLHRLLAEAEQDALHVDLSLDG